MEGEIKALREMLNDANMKLCDAEALIRIVYMSLEYIRDIEKKEEYRKLDLDALWTHLDNYQYAILRMP